MTESEAGGGHNTPWLVLRAQAGDRQALEQLLQRAQGILRPYVWAMVRDPAHASDVLQDVLLIVYRKLHTLQEPRAFAGWLRRIASRQIFRSLRRAAPVVFVDELPDVASEAECDDAALADVHERLPDLVARVSPASRAVLVMHYLEGLSLDETAAVLDISIGTAKSRLAYGLKALRRMVRTEGSV